MRTNNPLGSYWSRSVVAYSQAPGWVEVGHLHFHPRRFLAQQHVYLVPKLRSRSPRSGGCKRVVVSLGIPVGDYDEPVVSKLYEEHRAFVSGLPFGGRLHFLAPEPDRFVEVAWLHRVVDQRSVHYQSPPAVVSDVAHLQCMSV